MKTKKLINKFNKKANEWLTDLKQIDNKNLQIKPDENAWSLAELYDHIMRVARSYQIPNMKISVTPEAVQKKRKNKYGIALFILGFRKQVHINMDKFPQSLVEAFTPIQRSKEELIQDFEAFIQEVNALQSILNNSVKTNKHYHGMFGDLSTFEWFSLVEIHLWHHDKQREGIKKYLEIQHNL